jgi:multisubunit Na+/H+ antiporter MnhG subunit
MIGGVILGVILVILGVLLFVFSIILFETNDEFGGSLCFLMALLFLVGGICNLVITPIDYYEKRIPDLKEQVLQYEKDQLELELKELTEEKE